MKSIMGCCITIIIIIALLVGVVAGGVWYVSNMTLAELGLNDQVLVNGKTVAELGLSDVKIKDIINFISTIVTGVSEDVIVTHPYTDQDLTNVEGLLGGSNIIDPVTGDITFDNMDGGYVIFPNANPITFKDTELAALFNLIMQEGIASNDNQESLSEVEESEIMSIREVKLTVSGTSGATMRTVLRFDISDLGDQINSQVPAGASSYFQLGQYVYIITESAITADAEGKLQAGATHTVTINNLPSAISNPFMLLLVNAMMEGNNDGFKGADGEHLEPTAGFFAEMTCGLFAQFIYRFGVVGLTEANLGNSGFQAVTAGGGSITIIPWTVDTVPVEDSYLDNAYSAIASAKAGKAYNIAEFYLYKANNDTITLSTDDVDGYIDYLNNNGLNCVFGTAPILNTNVINVTYNGTDFTLVAVYTSEGSYTCEFLAYDNVNLQLKETFDYPVITRANIDLMVATAQADEVFYAASTLSTYYNDVTVTIIPGDIDDYINKLNTRYNLNVVYGTEAPSSNGRVLNISYISDMFAHGFAESYARYGTQTSTYSLSTL